MRVLLAGLLSAIRRCWFPAAYISLDRWRQGGRGDVVWVSPMAHHSGQPIRGDGGLLTCLAWWALSDWQSCKQHPSTQNQMAKHDQILCPLTALHRDPLEITLQPDIPPHSLWKQGAIHYGDRCHIRHFHLSLKVCHRRPSFIQSLTTCPGTTLTSISLCECVSVSRNVLFIVDLSRGRQCKQVCSSQCHFTVI